MISCTKMFDIGLSLSQGFLIAKYQAALLLANGFVQAFKLSGCSTRANSQSSPKAEEDAQLATRFDSVYAGEGNSETGDCICFSPLPFCTRAKIGQMFLRRSKVQNLATHGLI